MNLKTEYNKLHRAYKRKIKKAQDEISLIRDTNITDSSLFKIDIIFLFLKIYFGVLSFSQVDKYTSRLYGELYKANLINETSEFKFIHLSFDAEDLKAFIQKYFSDNCVYDSLTEEEIYKGVSKYCEFLGCNNESQYRLILKNHTGDERFTRKEYNGEPIQLYTICIDISKLEN